MLSDAEEFVRLRSSGVPSDYHRAAHDEASLATWLDVVARYPDMRYWVAQNKTVPHEVLAVLAHEMPFGGGEPARAASTQPNGTRWESVAE